MVEVLIPTVSELEQMTNEQVALLLFNHSRSAPESTNNIYSEINKLEKQLEKLRQQAEYEEYKREQWAKDHRNLSKYLDARLFPDNFALRNS